MSGMKGKENCECEDVWGEKCGGAGGGRSLSVGVRGREGEVCVGGPWLSGSPRQQ